MMTKDFKDVLRAFNAHAVKYLIVGGHAFGVHAQPRTTKDLDLFIRADSENAKAVFHALAQFGAPLEGMTPEDFTDGTAFQLGQPPDRIDILQKIDGVSFDEAWNNRIEGSIDGEVQASVISRDDLIRNKLASGREQDLLDVKQIRRAAEAMKRVPSEK
jgi:predicted nucleotidyltransferase